MPLLEFAGVAEIETPPDHDYCRHSWHLYGLRLNLEKLDITRDELIESLRAKEIGASVHFIPIPLHPFFEAYAHRAENHCPRAMALYPRIVSLPLYQTMTEEQVRYVAASVKQIVAAGRKRKSVALTAAG